MFRWGGVLPDIRTDILFCCIAYGFIPSEYLWYELEGKTYSYRNKFVSCRDKHLYQCVINDMIDSALVTDKVYTYQTYKDSFGREAIEISAEKHREEFVSFVGRHPVFVAKAVYMSGGKGVKKIDSSKFSGTVDDLFQSLLKEGKMLIEELLLQQEPFNLLNSDSVNTVRIVTFCTRNGIEIPFAFMRIGRKGSFVDNAGSMGISVGVDPETGVVNTDGYDELNNHYESHPDSKIKLNGFQLPEWGKAISIVKECATKIPSLKSISWDMAYTHTEEERNAEWKMIEANAFGDFINQIVTKIGYKEEMERLINASDTMIRL